MNIWFTGGGTGGHLYPGLAIARALVARRPEVRPFFVGAARGIEREILPTTEFPYRLLDLHPLYRPALWKNLQTVSGALAGWRALGEEAKTRRPSLIVGTGGYAAGLTMFWGSRQGIPVVQHIGDAIPGITARWSSRFTTEAYLGYPEAEKFLAPGRAVFRDTGNPIEPPPAVHPEGATARQRWGFPASATVLLVFGGSQGARALNEGVAKWIAAGLPPGLFVLWATGRSHFEAYRAHDSAGVRVVPYLSPISDAYAAADLALVRGGMMGTSELCAWGIPMVIVPLPTAAHDHQTANARVLAAAGAAVHLPQSELSPAQLTSIVAPLMADASRRATMAAAARARGRPTAAADIAAHIDALLTRISL